MAPTKKTVCIVGAGPSGLVAAKTLLHSPQARGRFHVTVFESQPRLGGLWPSRPDDGGGLLHPHMLANQSRHTMQFSGMPWAGVDTAGEAAAAADQPEPALFPRAWQVGAYLQRYYDAYCAGRDDVAVRLRCRVTRTEPVDGGRGGWHVWTRATAAHPEKDDASAGSETDAGIFDYLLVAAGYFGRPVWPDGVQPTTTGGSIPVLHSSQYRSLSTLFPSTTTPPRPGTILVVGGQFSGVDIAATIADHLSAAANAPRSSPSPSPAAGLPDPDACVVHHLIQRPFWVLPLRTSPRPGGPAPPPFLPLDLTSYDLSRRAPGPLSDTQGLIAVDVARRVHGFMETLLGSDQAEVHPALALPRGGDGAGAGAAVRDAPVYLAVSDTYLEHVRAGHIRLSRGRLAGLSAGKPVLTADPSTDQLSAPPVPEDVVAVVLATGFAPADHALSFLPPALLRDVLAFDRSDTRQAAALAFHATHHPDLPQVAFVGFYRSPYWGVMEMQARLATALFVSDADAADIAEPGDSGVSGGPAPWYPAAMPLWPRLAPALAADRSIARTLDLRANPARAAQFPMGDYLYLMDAFAQALDLPRQPNPVDLSALGGPSGGRPSVMDVLTPADYAADAGVRDTAASLQAFCRAETAATVRAGLFDGRFVAGAIFRALQGTWQLDRTLVSRLPSHPSGRFRGTASFRLRAATDADAGAGAEADETALSEYLYVEEGLFAADGAAGLTFPASRRYVWRYDDARNRLSVWFARTDDASRADYLFHELAFASGRPAATETGPPAAQPWQATAGHLCVDDFYDVHYEFFFAGVHLREWRLRYAVRGPKKDYTLDGVYRR